MGIRRVMAAALTALLMVGVLAAVGAQQKVRFVLKDLDTDPNAEKFVALIEEGLAKAGTPVDLELLKTPSGNYAEKIGLMVMSGDIPDLIYFQGGDEKLAQQGVLEDLTPYVAKSKYLKSLMDAHSASTALSCPKTTRLSVFSRSRSVSASSLDTFFGGMRAILATTASISLVPSVLRRLPSGSRRCAAPASSITSMALSGSLRSLM